MLECAETLRVDMNIALREAGRAFDRGDYREEERRYEEARDLQKRIYCAEWQAQTATERGIRHAS